MAVGPQLHGQVRLARARASDQMTHTESAITSNDQNGA